MLIHTLIQDSPCTGSLKWPIFIAQTATQTIVMTYTPTTHISSSTVIHRFVTNHFTVNPSVVCALHAYIDNNFPTTLSHIGSL